jgi:hypothetical protein
MSAESSFNQFLAFLKDHQNQRYLDFSPRGGIFIESPKFSFHESRSVLAIQPIAITIMESGIFYEGKLKGRKISNKYRLYNIDNLEALVLGAGVIIDEALYGHLKPQSVPPSEIRREYEAGNISEEEYEVYFCDEVSGNLKSFLLYYDNVSKIILEYKGARPEKVAKIHRELESMITKTLTKLPPPPSFFPEAILTIIGLFKKCVPMAPDQTLAARITGLLYKFNIEVKEETIRKKLQTEGPFDIKVFVTPT